MFVAGTAVGDDSICHVVRMEEEESSCSSLQQYALAAYVRGMILLLDVATLISQPQTVSKNVKLVFPLMGL